MIMLNRAELERLREILKDANEPELSQKVMSELEHQKWLDDFLTKSNDSLQELHRNLNMQ